MSDCERLLEDELVESEISKAQGNIVRSAFLQGPCIIRAKDALVELKKN